MVNYTPLSLLMRPKYNPLIERLREMYPWQTFFHRLERQYISRQLVHRSGHVSRTRRVKFSRTDMSIRGIPARR